MKMHCINVCYLVYFITVVNRAVGGKVVDIPVGLIVDRESTGVLQAFQTAVKWYNNKTVIESSFGAFRLIPKVAVLDVTDSFAVSNTICSHLDDGVLAILGIYKTSALSTIQSYSDTFKVPLFTLSAAPKSTSAKGFQIYMRPISTTAVVDVMLDFGWKQVVYIYNSDEGLIRLQELFNTLQLTDYPIEIDVKRIVDEKGCLSTLRELGRITHAFINVLLDVPYKEALSILYQMVEDDHIDVRKFKVIIADVAATTEDLTDLSRHGINITAFQLLPFESGDRWKQKISDIANNNSSKELQCGEALTVDSVELLTKALGNLRQYWNIDVHKLRQTETNHTRNILKCAEKDIVISPYGNYVMESLKKTRLQGLSGSVAFDTYGHRDNFSLDVMQTCPKHIVQKIGMWTPLTRLSTYSTIADFQTTVLNKTKIVTVVTAKM